MGPRSPLCNLPCETTRRRRKLISARGIFGVEDRAVLAHLATVGGNWEARTSHACRKGETPKQHRRTEHFPRDHVIEIERMTVVRRLENEGEGAG